MKITVARKFFAAGAIVAGLTLSACASHEVPMQKASLYDRLGGKPAIEAVVGQFLHNVVADDRINAFFANADANDLSAKLVDLICQGTGGPCTYTGKDMKAAHQGMGVKEADFNALVEDLVAALDEFNVPEQEKGELLGILGPMKNAIVEG
jgi:hemoglobin